MITKFIFTVFFTAVYFSSFGQSINMVRNASKAVYSCGGTVYDHGGVSGDYLNNSSDTLIIYPNVEGKALELRTTTVAINQYGSQDGVVFLGGLELVDGGTTYTRTYVSGFNTDDTYYRSKSDDGSISLIFESYDEYTSAGFEFSVRCVDKTTIVPNEIVVPSSGSMSFTTCEVLVTDDGINSDYFSSENGVLTINPSDIEKKMRLEFNSLDIASGDLLTVYDGTDVSSDILGEFSGSNIPSNVFASNTDGALTLKFTSNTSIQGSGFDINATCSDGYDVVDEEEIVVPVFGIETRSTCDSKVFDSGGEDSHYFNDSDGVLVIYPDDENKRVKLDVESFTTEYSFDKIFIYDGDNILATELIEYSGSSIPTTEFVATNVDGALTIRFDSDLSINYEGFSITTSCLDVIPELLVPESGHKSVTSCDTTFFDGGGANMHYANNSDGTLTIYPDNDSLYVELDVNSFNTEYAYDYIHIYDGINDDANELIEYAGVFISSNSFKASNEFGALTVRFESDFSNTAEGFEITTSCFKPILFVPQIGHESITICDTVLYDAGGFDRYSNNFDGSLTIYPESDSLDVSLLVNSYSSYGHDSIYIYDGINADADELIQYSGTDIPNKVFEATNEYGALTIRFVTDFAFPDEGFEIETSCVTRDILVDVNDTKIVNRLHLYPNPSNGDFLNVKIQDEVVIAVVAHSVDGDIFFLEYSNGVINIEDLALGIYAFEITTDNKTYLKKVVVN